LCPQNSQNFLLLFGIWKTEYYWEVEMVQAIVTYIIGLLTIVVNIGVTLYNKGKNRNIYEVKIAVIEGDKVGLINNLLKDGKYTVLFAGQDFNNTRMTRYVLGRVK
jgi:hypothetical protein